MAGAITALLWVTPSPIPMCTLRSGGGDGTSPSSLGTLLAIQVCLGPSVCTCLCMWLLSLLTTTSTAGEDASSAGIGWGAKSSAPPGAGQRGLA